MINKKDYNLLNNFIKNDDLVNLKKNIKGISKETNINGINIINNELGHKLLINAIKTNKTKIARYLIENGCEIKKELSDGNDVLSLTIKYDNLEIFKLLIDVEMDYSKKYNGYTILMLAVKYANFDMVKFIVSITKGINEINNINLISELNKTALDLAKDDKIKKLLIKNGGKTAKEINDLKENKMILKFNDWNLINI